MLGFDKNLEHTFLISVESLSNIVSNSDLDKELLHERKINVNNIRNFFITRFLLLLPTVDARTRGDLATEFFPLPQDEFRKKKRTIYRKASHEF